MWPNCHEGRRQYAPIISLAAIGRLDLLEQLFGKITIAEAVYQEIKAKQSYGTDELDEMIAKGRWYSAAVYRAFLQQAGEL